MPLLFRMPPRLLPIVAFRVTLVLLTAAAAFKPNADRAEISTKEIPSREDTPTSNDEVHQNTRGVLRFVNARWTSIAVEIRMGADSTCNRHSRLKTRTLERGETWGFSGTMPICWRRELDPSVKNGSRTTWKREDIAESGNRGIAL